MTETFLYDVHVHTNSEPLINDIDNIISICRDKKIRLNAIGTDYEDSLEACKQARKYPDVIRATIGIHPDYINDIKDIDKLEQLYLEYKDVIVAIGEIGLDYYGNVNKDKEKQKLFFKKLLALADKYNLPVCVHVRDAEEDCLEVLKEAKHPNNIWIHCYAKGPELAKQYIDRGYMISIPGIVTFKNGKEVQEAIKVIPLDRLMVETDGPYLAPVPNRGKTNYPHYVEFTARDIANRLNIPFEDFAKQVTNNTFKFFRLEK